MHVISISNRKGGTGKTSVAVNLATELAVLGQRVLLIDLDSQGHCAVGLGIKSVSSDKTVHRLLIDPQIQLADIIMETPVSNLLLAPADTFFDHGTGPRDDGRLKAAFEQGRVSERFDCLVLDTPPSLDNLLMNALLCATRVLIPYVPHHLSFEGVRQLVRALFPVMTRHNKRLKILGFLPTMAAEHIKQHRSITGQVNHEFGASRLLPAIRNDIRLAESFAAGKPIRFYAPKSRAAEDFACLAEEVIQRLGAGS